MSHWNRYYLDSFYFSRVYVVSQVMATKYSGNEIALQDVCLNWGKKSMAFNRPHTAIGMFYKCLNIKDLDERVGELCYAGINNVERSGLVLKKSVDYIKSVTHFDLFSLQWILRDMDRSIM